MRVGLPEGVTRELGGRAGTAKLPIVDTVMYLPEDGEHVPHECMVSVWYPSPEELRALQAGGYVALIVLGTVHPPVRVDVLKADGYPVEEGVMQ